MEQEKPKIASAPEIEAVYPVVSHLKELRKRVVYSLLCVLVFFCLCYWQSSYIFIFLTAPIRPLIDASPTVSLTTLKLTEAFFVELKISLIAGMLVSMPFLIYQFWKFVAPGLYRNERRYLVGFVFFATLLFLCGASFVYFMIFPLGFKFFLHINEINNMATTLSIEWYIDFVLKLIVAFGLVFELPVVIFFLTKIGLVNTAILKKYRKIAIVMIFVLAAFITPPDVISQLAMAGPMLILYELSIWITKVFGSDSKKVQVDNGEHDIYE